VVKTIAKQTTFKPATQIKSIKVSETTEWASEQKRLEVALTEGGEKNGKNDESKKGKRKEHLSPGL